KERLPIRRPDRTAAPSARPPAAATNNPRRSDLGNAQRTGSRLAGCRCVRTIQDMSSTSTRRFNEADIRRSISRLLITHDLSWEEFIAKGEADELAELDGDLDFAYKALAAHIEPVQGAPTVKPAEAVEEFHRTYGL